VDGVGELGGWMPAARWVGGRGRRAQRPRTESQGSRPRLAVPQGTRPPAAHHGSRARSWLEKRDGREGRSDGPRCRGGSGG
jgi:hypothetical protein